MKKLVFVTTRLFWPTDSGRKVSLYYYCKGLHEKYGYDIYAYSFLDPDQSEHDVDNKPDFIKDVMIAKKIGAFTKIKNLFTKSILKYWPFQNSVFYSKENINCLREFCRDISPDVIIVDMVRLAPYYDAIFDLPCKKILDLDDLISNRYFRQSKSLSSKTNALGNQKNNLKILSKILKNNLIKKIVLKSEAKRVSKFEKYYGQKYDNVIFVSDKETCQFNSTFNESKAVTIRIGVDTNFYRDNSFTKENHEKIILSFLGNLKIVANIDSLRNIIDNILPLLNFDYEFRIVGACENDIINDLSNEKIKFLGRVDDLRPVIKESDIFLSPILYGSGVKTKILEAMAMGVPVVTNNIGIEGIDGENFKHFFVFDSNENISEFLNDNYNNDALLDKVAYEGQKIVQKLYDWETIYKAFSILGL